MHRSLVLLLAAFTLAAQQPTNPESTDAPVIFNGDSVFVVHTPYHGVSPSDRAANIVRRLTSLAKTRSISADSIRIEEAPGKGSLVLVGDTVLMTITDEEAAAAQKPRSDYAAGIADKMRGAVLHYRDEWSLRHILQGAAYTLGATLILFLVLTGVSRLHRYAVRKILASTMDSDRFVPFAESGILSARRISAVLLTIEGAARWVVLLTILQAYVAAVFSFFPGTSGLASTFYSWVLTPLESLRDGALYYLPNLFFVVVVSAATFYILKLNKFVFLEVRDGKIAIPGFHTDLAEPTGKLVSILIFAIAVVVVFPYLPGSDSPAFKGVSILFGVLISFGSGSAVANMISGAILTYMRPFNLGDRVKIADTVGDVIEKSLFVTRVRTIKNVVVTIPNSGVLGTHILNYSTAAREGSLILHTGVTIGYGAPWRGVHELLIGAALATPGILSEPSPFVYQTALSDFYVSYQINAFTADAARMQAIYSDLHKNIQDKFNEAGVEIMSPHNFTLRDGNPMAIPENYYPPDYRPPSFRVGADQVNKSRETA
jgi:small-conductance mechanosensitive channel